MRNRSCPFLVGVVSLALLSGCKGKHDSPTKHPVTDHIVNFDLGEESYKILHGYFAAQQGPPARRKLAVVEKSQPRFVWAMNETFPRDARRQLPSVLDTIFAAADDGTLDQLVDVSWRLVTGIQQDAPALEAILQASRHEEFGQVADAGKEWICRLINAPWAEQLLLLFGDALDQDRTQVLEILSSVSRLLAGLDPDGLIDQRLLRDLLLLPLKNAPPGTKQPSPYLSDTFLAFVMKQLGAALRQGLWDDWTRLYDQAVLAPGEKSPLLGLGHGVRLLGEHPMSPRFAHTLHFLCRKQPDFIEGILRRLEKADFSAFGKLPTASWLPPALRLLQLLDGILQTGDRTAIARQFLEVCKHSCTAPDGAFSPAKKNEVLQTLKLLISFRRLYATCATDSATDAAVITYDFARSEPVDYTRPPIYQDASGRTVDNRNILEQLLPVLKKLDEADLGTNYGIGDPGQPFTTLAVLLMAVSPSEELQPQLGAILEIPLQQLPPEDQKLRPYFVELQRLLLDGSLFATQPLCRLFIECDNGEPTGSYMKILATGMYQLAHAYAPADLRAVSPVLAVSADHELAHILVELAYYAPRLPSGLPEMSFMDVLAVSLADLFQARPGMKLRDGRPCRDYIELLGIPLLELDTLLRQTQLTPSWDRIKAFLGKAWQGLAGSPHWNGRLVAILDVLAEHLERKLPADDEAREEACRRYQAEMEGLLLGGGGALSQTFTLMMREDRRKVSGQFLGSLLFPEPAGGPAAPPTLFDPTLRLVAGLLKIQVTPAELKALSLLLSRVLHPEGHILPEGIAALASLTRKDREQVLLVVPRRLLRACPGAGRPLDAFLKLWADLSWAETSGISPSGPITVQQAQVNILQPMAEAISDPVHGLRGFVKMLKNRVR